MMARGDGDEGETVTSAVPSTPSLVALIIACPSARALTMPVGVTVAVASSLLAQVRVLGVVECTTHRVCVLEGVSSRLPYGSAPTAGWRVRAVRLSP